MQPNVTRVPMTWLTPAGDTTTLRFSGVECVRAPEVPTTLTAYDPGSTAGPRTRLNWELAELPIAGVTEVGLKDRTEPTGWPDPVSTTAWLNVAFALTVTVLEPLPSTKSVS